MSIGCCICGSVFYLGGKFLQPGDKKKGLANPIKGFLRFKRKKTPYLDQKNLEVAIFRQCVPVGRQSIGTVAIYC